MNDRIWPALFLICVNLVGCGSGDTQVASRTECRTDANGRLVCTTYEPVKKEAQ